MSYGMLHGMDSGGEIPAIKNTTAGITFEVEVPDTYNVPITPEEGLQNNSFSMETTTLRGRRAIQTLLSKAKEIIFPEYYENADLNFVSTFKGYSSPFNQNTVPGYVKTLTFKGPGALVLNRFMSWECLETVNANSAASVNLSPEAGTNVVVSYDSRKITVYANNATEITVGSYDMDNTTMSFEIYNSAIKNLIPYPMTGYNFTSTSASYRDHPERAKYHFTGAEKITNNTATGFWGGTLYLPALKEIEFFSANSVLASTEWHIGSELTTLNVGAANALAANTGGIYIPTGDSATKTTLDYWISQGYAITYSQE